MKTLDEVIERFEDDLHAAEADSQLIMLFDRDVVDAIHYLKEYSSKQDTIAEQLEELERQNDKVCDLAKTVTEAYDRLTQRLAEENRNVPLTWDELKAVEGKPVWVEFEKHGNHWLIITDVMKNGAVGRGMYGENVPLYQDSIGKTWQAYRKERE